MYTIEEIRSMSDEQLKGIVRQLNWLACLEDAGVDNWSGIDYAYETANEAGVFED